MKVLLVGEMSGLHSYLRDGLNALGHAATVMARADGFKKFKADIPLDGGLGGVWGGVAARLLQPLHLARSRGYDVTQLINAFSLSGRGMAQEFSLRQMEKVAPSFFLLAAGSDAMFWRYGREKLKKGLFDDHLEYDLKAKIEPLETAAAHQWNLKVAGASAGVIPIMYEYEVSYEHHPKRLKTIPLPVNLEKIPYRDNRVGKKLVVFHGLNRYGFKGTRLVEEAFSELGRRYPNDLELVIDGRMPHEKYLDLMARTNVVIDQIYSHSLGVNGIQALAMGKVVLGGVEPESLQSLGLDSSPAIGLQPSVRSIIENVENLLARRDEVASIGYESRKFVEKVHDCVKVAQRYVSTWNRAVYPSQSDSPIEADQP